MDDTADDRIVFEAAITPHRSASTRARHILLAVLTFFLVLDAVAFSLIGAWPVGGFAGLELLAAILLFRWHARSDRATELLLLSRRELRILRTDPAGRRHERKFSPAWLTARIEETPGRAAELLLTGNGIREPIAMSLGEAERRDLAAALSAALHDLRHPSFDNPVLNE